MSELMFTSNPTQSQGTRSAIEIDEPTTVMASDRKYRVRLVYTEHPKNPVTVASANSSSEVVREIQELIELLEEAKLFVQRFRRGISHEMDGQRQLPEAEKPKIGGAPFKPVP